MFCISMYTLWNEKNVLIAELGYERYKFCVNVLIGEQRGAGVQVGSRCLWDIDTDNYASDIFLNVSYSPICTY